MIKQHVLDGEYIPRCVPCLHKQNQCVNYGIARKMGTPVDHCPYYTTLKQELPDAVRD